MSDSAHLENASRSAALNRLILEALEFLLEREAVRLRSAVAQDRARQWDSEEPAVLAHDETIEATGLLARLRAARQQVR